MSRFVSAANETASEQPRVMICLAVDLDFADGAVRVCDAPVNITIDGNSFIGIGNQATGGFGSVEVVEEGIDVIARAVTMRVSGVDSANIENSLDAPNYQGRSALLYMALFNVDTQALIDEPELLWSGRMDTANIRLAGEQSEIVLRCEHRLRREPLIARYTNEDQQLAYPGDRGFDLVPKIPGFVGKWGQRDILSPRQRDGFGSFLENFVRGR